MGSKSPPKGRPNQMAEASRKAVQQGPATSQTLILEQQTFEYQGDIPPAQILQAFDDRWPGTAQKIIDGAMAEAAHRRDMERQVTEGNVRAQARHLDIVERANLAKVEVARKGQNTDRFGFVVGAAVCLICAGLAAYVAVLGLNVAAGFIAAIPTAGVVAAILNRKPSAEPPAK